MTLRELGHRLFGPSSPRELPSDPWKATSDEIRQIVSPCPICEGCDLSGQSYGLFASQIAVEESRDLATFFDHYRARRWQELHGIKEFEGRYNAAIIYAFFCTKGSCMLAVRDPVELFDRKELLHVTVLDDDEAAVIKEMQIETHPL